MLRWPISRRDFIGRRFLTVQRSEGDSNSEQGLDIRRGVIRASSHADLSMVDSKILVEFDDSADWRGRQWVSVYIQFDIFMIEDTLVGVQQNPALTEEYQPALTYTTLVDKIKDSNHLRLVEYLKPSRSLDYVSDSQIRQLTVEDIVRLYDSDVSGAYGSVVREWVNFQQSQQVLNQCPSRAVSRRVKVYNIDHNCQWYFGTILGCNENSKAVAVRDDSGMQRVERAALLHLELNSKDSSFILREVAMGTKPRGRISSEEHPMIKQPKLDVPVCTSPGISAVKSPPAAPKSKVSFGGGGHQAGESVSVTADNRNVFQSLIDVGANKNQNSAIKLGSKPLVLPLPPDAVAPRRIPMVVTDEASSVLSAAGLTQISRPPKTEKLFDYQSGSLPPSVMIVLPTPASGVLSKDGPQFLVPSSVSSNFSVGNLGVESGNSKHLSNPPLSNVTYIGTIAVNGPNSKQFQVEPAAARSGIVRSPMPTAGQNPATRRSDGGLLQARHDAPPFENEGFPNCSSGGQMHGPVEANAVADNTHGQQRRSPTGMQSVLKGYESQHSSSNPIRTIHSPNFRGPSCVSSPRVATPGQLVLGQHVIVTSPGQLQVQAYLVTSPAGLQRKSNVHWSGTDQQVLMSNLQNSSPSQIQESPRTSDIRQSATSCSNIQQISVSCGEDASCSKQGPVAGVNVMGRSPPLRLAQGSGPVMSMVGGTIQRTMYPTKYQQCPENAGLTETLQSPRLAACATVSSKNEVQNSPNMRSLLLSSVSSSSLNSVLNQPGLLLAVQQNQGLQGSAQLRPRAQLPSEQTRLVSSASQLESAQFQQNQGLQVSPQPRPRTQTSNQQTQHVGSASQPESSQFQQNQGLPEAAQCRQRAQISNQQTQHLSSAGPPESSQFQLNQGLSDAVQFRPRAQISNPRMRSALSAPRVQSPLAGMPRQAVAMHPSNSHQIDKRLSVAGLQPVCSSPRVSHKVETYQGPIAPTGSVKTEVVNNARSRYDLKQFQQQFRLCTSGKSSKELVRELVEITLRKHGMTPKGQMIKKEEVESQPGTSVAEIETPVRNESQIQRGFFADGDEKAGEFAGWRAKQPIAFSSDAEPGVDVNRTASKGIQPSSQISTDAVNHPFHSPKSVGDIPTNAFSCTKGHLSVSDQSDQLETANSAFENSCAKFDQDATSKGLVAPEPQTPNFHKFGGMPNAVFAASSMLSSAEASAADVLLRLSQERNISKQRCPNSNPGFNALNAQRATMNVAGVTVRHPVVSTAGTVDAGRASEVMEQGDGGQRTFIRNKAGGPIKGLPSNRSVVISTTPVPQPLMQLPKKRALSELKRQNSTQAQPKVRKTNVSTCDKSLKSGNKSATGSARNSSRAQMPVPASKAAGAGEKNWYDEYKDELGDLTCVLDTMKRLDAAGKRIKGVSMLPASGKVQKSQPLSDQTRKINIGDRILPPENLHKTIVAPYLSDCEAKMKFFHQQISALELKFESPSAALSKKKLNSMHASANGHRLYVQDKSCLMLSSLLLKCRECKSACNYPNKLSLVLCRFHAFRRLTRTAKGSYVSNGFSSPTDADAIDISLWMPMLPIVNPQIDISMAKYIVKNVGSRFCELVEQEKEAMSWVSTNNEVAWKRAVQGIREMCDVCSTTLFNIHWVCRKCGYVVCLDCYRTALRKCTHHHSDVSCPACDLGTVKWAKCSVNRQSHEPKEMMLTQIIPSDVLWVVGKMIHDIRKKWKIWENCPCGEDRILDFGQESTLQEQVNQITQSDDKISSSCLKKEEASHIKIDREDNVKTEVDESTSKNLENESSGDVDQKSKKSRHLATLREFLLENHYKIENEKVKASSEASCRSLSDVIRRVVTGKHHLAESNSNSSSAPTSRDIPSTGTAGSSSAVDDKNSSPTEVPHIWLDNGRLLQLPEPRHPGNLEKFQEVWRKGQPVVISNCNQYITKELWLPESFTREFGEMENDLVDCAHKVILIGHKMRNFWQGFEKVSARLKDATGQPMILKLKDWPPMEDFSEMLPSRFEDLLQGLPLPEYTHRSGVFNLASRLPEYFVRPDLGPKMYNAYGSALHPLVGSTNLHLDVSDAVNLILYVGVPKDDVEDHEAAALEAMKQAGCCELTMDRVVKEGRQPGALWHIFDAKDSDKIRDLLTKVGLEIGEPVEAHHDPIHDQSWYLDEKLRERLLHEYNVQGYTIVQCVGDAIFIPAGAPHQVRNLHSCIKAAEDFVSPENLSHCFRMTQEFRHLSDTHSNHEDKLQVKNIIYHAVKDAIAVLQNHDPDES